MELINLGFGIVIFFGVVPRLWKRVFLDCQRDRLIDLRDSVRAYFLHNGYGLNHPQYKNLCDLLNAHLRFVENCTFFSVLILRYLFKKNKKAFEYQFKSVEKLFKTDDRKVAEYILETRDTGVRIVSEYAVFSSMLFCFFLVVLGMGIGIFKLGKRFGRSASVNIGYGFNSSTKLFVQLLSNSFLPNPKYIEEYSYSSCK